MNALPAPARPALLIAAAAILTLATVWILQIRGYAPCELCLKERIPFYAAVPLAALVGLALWRGRTGLLPAGYAALALVFLVGAGLGVYHAGVEWHFWPGPSSCTGSTAHAAAVSDFLQDLQKTQVVRCDAPAMQVAGLSLAGWNALLCLGLVAVAIYGFARSDTAAR